MFEMGRIDAWQASPLIAFACHVAHALHPQPLCNWVPACAGVMDYPPSASTSALTFC